MKKLFNYLIATALMAFTFTSCEDVPSPFGDIVKPDSGGEEVVIEPSGDGTEANPYNVAGVLEFISGLGADIPSTKDVYVKGIITDSNTGDTARNLAAFRGPNPVLAICYNDKLQRLLNLSYGVIPVLQKEHIAPQQLFLAAVRMLRQKGYVDLDDKIAYLSGNMGAGGTTKFLEINTVREVFDQNYQFHLPKM